MNKELKRRKSKIKKQFQASESFTVSFICSGNIIRSPYAHILFFHMIEGDSNLKNRIKVESGGVEYRNSSISYESCEILLRKGVSEKEVFDFKPRYYPDYPDMFKMIDLILVMEKNHIKYLPRSVHDRAFLLLEFTLGISENVPDPFFDPPFERAYKMIDKSLEYLLEFFKDITKN
ncbi:MAG: hypothetical protein ACFFAU_15665, partial [Candidatus Hodarchaeota archaeon]